MASESSRHCHDIKSGEHAFTLLAQPLLAEFFAMLLHTFWGSMALATSQPIHYEKLNVTIEAPTWDVNYVVSTLMPAFQAGFSVWMIIVLFWKICVVNINPAVSVGFVITGVLHPLLLVPYIAMQNLGSIVGAIIAQAIKREDPPVFLIPEDANIVSVFCLELMATGAVTFFAIAVVVEKNYDQATGPLAIGLSVFQGILAGKWIGAGCLNPARAFGPAVVVGGQAWTRHWVWWTGDLVGAAVFSLVYMMVFAPHEKNWMMRALRKRNHDPSGKYKEPVRTNESKL